MLRRPEWCLLTLLFGACIDLNTVASAKPVVLVDGGMETDAQVGLQPDASPDAAPSNLGAAGGPCHFPKYVEYLGDSIASAVGECRYPLVCGFEGECAEEQVCKSLLREPCEFKIPVARPAGEVKVSTHYMYWTEACSHDEYAEGDASHDGRIMRVDVQTGKAEALAANVHIADQLFVDSGAERLLWRERRYEPTNGSYYQVRGLSLTAPHQSWLVHDHLGNVHDADGGGHWYVEGKTVWVLDAANSAQLHLIGKDASSGAAHGDLTIDHSWDSGYLHPTLFVSSSHIVFGAPNASAPDGEELFAYQREDEKLTKLDYIPITPWLLQADGLLMLGAGSLQKIPLDGSSGYSLGQLSADGLPVMGDSFVYWTQRMPFGSAVVQAPFTKKESLGTPTLLAGIPVEDGGLLPRDASAATVFPMLMGVIWLRQDGSYHYVPTSKVPL